jgi:small GTP-binding protein
MTSLTSVPSEFKIVMLGDTGVGKTSLVLCLCGTPFESNIQSTVGCAYVTKTIELQNKSVILNVWDTAGQERFTSLVPLYVRNSHGVVLVYDVRAEEPIANLDLIYQNTAEHIRPHMQFILCANKTDLLESDPDMSSVSVWAHSHGMDIVLVSARTGEGVHAMFVKLAEKITSQGLQILKMQSEGIVEDICQGKGKKKKVGCC